MISDNRTTLQSYEDHIADYVAGTNAVVDGGVQEWLDKALFGLLLNAVILELGSGTGRDAAYIRHKGYFVECTDAVQGFVEMMVRKGIEARHLDILDDPLPQGRYDLIIANAVLLHFTEGETEKVTEKVYKALKPDGRFAFTVKTGEGEKWTHEKLGAPRYYRFWKRKEMKNLIVKKGFAVQFLSENDTGHDSGAWLSVVARKALVRAGRNG